MNSHAVPTGTDIGGRIEAETGVRLSHCYQCGKCTAGCLVAGHTDIPVSRLLRMLQLGFPQLEEQVLRSEALWICLTCETCASRCPQEVELAKVVDFLRHESLRRGLAHRRSADILAFHRSLLDSVKHTGRLYEVGLIAAYKVRTMRLLQDVMLAPRMVWKGKLGLLPHRIKDRKGIRALFRRASGKG